MTTAPIPSSIPTDAAPGTGAPNAARKPPRPMSTLMRWGGGALAAYLVIIAAVQTAGWIALQHDERTETFDATPSLRVEGTGAITVQVDPEASGTTVHIADQWGFTRPSFTAMVDPDGTLALHSSCGGPVPWLTNDGSCASDLTITVAPETVVDLRTSTGTIAANGLEGDVTAHSEDGDVRVGQAGGTVTATTSAGVVEVQDSAASVEARSSDGAVSVRHAGGPVRARSSAGRVVVDGATGDVRAESVDGDVSVSDVRGAVVATTSSGRADVIDVTGDAEVRSADGNVEVRAVLGDIVAQTSAGSATVYAAPDGKAVALTIETSAGRSTVEAPTDPGASRTVKIRSNDGDVSYLAG